MHFSTDINLLWDAIRKAIQTCARFCDTLDLTEWRQSAYHLRCFKKSYRLIQKLKYSTSQDEAKQRIDDEAITKKPLQHTSMLKKCLNQGKGVSKIRQEWLICIIESGQKKKRTHLHRKTAGIMISESAEL